MLMQGFPNIPPLEGHPFPPPRFLHHSLIALSCVFLSFPLTFSPPPPPHQVCLLLDVRPRQKRECPHTRRLLRTRKNVWIFDGNQSNQSGEGASNAATGRARQTPNGESMTEIPKIAPPRILRSREENSVPATELSPLLVRKMPFQVPCATSPLPWPRVRNRHWANRPQIATDALLLLPVRSPSDGRSQQLIL